MVRMSGDTFKSVSDVFDQSQGLLFVVKEGLELWSDKLLKIFN